MSLGTNLCGVFSCVRSFWTCADGVWSDSNCKVWEPKDTLVVCSMSILIGSVLANQRGVWGGRGKHFFPSATSSYNNEPEKQTTQPSVQL